jgi:nucleoside-diphosphate-sugar epimerase
VRAQSAPHVSWVLVRPTSIWGPWFDVPYKGFFTSVENGHYRHPRGRRILKSFGYVGNLAHALARLASSPEAVVAGKVFFLADYEPIDVREWSRTIARHFGVRDVREIPYALMKLAALVGEVLQATRLAEPPITSWRLNNLVTNMIYPMAPTAEVAGALPFSVDEGVATTVAWMRGKPRF